MEDIRDLVHDNPLQAVVVASEAPELEQDYVCSHLGIDPDMLRWFAAVARTAQMLRDPNEWDNDWLKLCPDIVLHKFACDCAARACSRSDQVGRESWVAIRAKRRWLRGEISDEDLRIAGWNAACAADSAAGSIADSAAAWTPDRDAGWASKGAASCASACVPGWTPDRDAGWAKARNWQRERLALLCERFVLGRIRA